MPSDEREAAAKEYTDIRTEGEDDHAKFACRMDYFSGWDAGTRHARQAHADEVAKLQAENQVLADAARDLTHLNTALQHTAWCAFMQAPAVRKPCNCKEETP